MPEWTDYQNQPFRIKKVSSLFLLTLEFVISFSLSYTQLLHFTQLLSYTHLLKCCILLDPHTILILLHSKVSVCHAAT